MQRQCVSVAGVESTIPATSLALGSRLVAGALFAASSVRVGRPTDCGREAAVGSVFVTVGEGVIGALRALAVAGRVPPGPAEAVGQSPRRSCDADLLGDRPDRRNQARAFDRSSHSPAILLCSVAPGPSGPNLRGTMLRCPSAV